MSKKISSYSFLLLAHYATFAYQDLLFEYLTKNNARLVTKMNFPLPELPYLKFLEITQSEKGINIHTKKYMSVYYPPIIAYAFQSIQLILYLLFSFKRYDVLIAEDSLMAGIGIFLSRIGICKKVIFYSHGVDKKRFSISFLNFLYQQLDKFSAKNSSFNWFLNRNFFEIRKNQGIPKSRLFWMPASVPVENMRRKENVFNQKIVFLGVVNKKNGAHIFLDIVKKVKMKIPTIQLDIIGNGDFLTKIQAALQKSDIKKNINLLGLLEFKNFSNILTNYSVGIAPYEDRFDTLTASSDSMKMRVYLAAGLPVVITKGFIFSDEIDKKKLGVSVPFTAQGFADAIIKLLENKKYNLDIRRRALLYSKETDIYTIYDKTFKKIL